MTFPTSPSGQAAGLRVKPRFPQRKALLEFPPLCQPAYTEEPFLGDENQHVLGTYCMLGSQTAMVPSPHTGFRGQTQHHFVTPLLKTARAPSCLLNSTQVPTLACRTQAAPLLLRSSTTCSPGPEGQGWVGGGGGGGVGVGGLAWLPCAWLRKLTPLHRAFRTGKNNYLVMFLGEKT